jgi:hypothetical protein
MGQIYPKTTRERKDDIHPTKAADMSALGMAPALLRRAFSIKNMEY